VSCANDQASEDGFRISIRVAICSDICVLGRWTHRKAGHLVSSIPIVAAVLTGARAWRGVTVRAGVAHAGWGGPRTRTRTLLQIR
jgi:hypothetical protein